MNIATYKTAIKTWVEAQSGITAQWRDEAGGWQSKTRARLHLHGTKAKGTDWVSYTQDTDLDPGVDYIPTFKGNREITLSIFVESRNQAGSNVAIWYLEKLRTSLRKDSVKALLKTAGLAYSTVETPQDLSQWVDDRIESKASMDIHFNAVVNEIDADEADSFVETAGIAATLTKPDGADTGWDEEAFPG